MATGTAAAGVFVGRRREMDHLHAALDAAQGRRGSLFLLLGEAGIGKTRLADEFSAAAQRRGARVLWGRSWEAGGTPAFWPWVQALRTLARDPDPAVRQAVSDDEAILAALLPEVGGDATTDVADDDGARLRLFDAVANLLERVAELTPVVVVLDDLHAADLPSLLLLRFVAGRIARAGIVMVAALRPPTGPPDTLLVQTVAHLMREPAVRIVTVDGLTREDVIEYGRAVGERALEPAVAAMIHDRTGGNALFVAEVVRLIDAGQADGSKATTTFTVPPTIREAIGRRLDGLPRDVRDVLSVASVLGREFQFAVLAALAGVEHERLLDALDVAARAAVVAPVGPGLSRDWRFSHVLLRETLYETLGARERVRLHRAAVAALSGVGEEDERLPELAHHAYLSLPGGDAILAASLARRAGERALASLAFEEAARLFEMALHALEAAGGSATERCEVFLALGDAQARAGELEASRDTFLRAATVARRAEAPEALARAAFGYGGRFAWLRAGRDPHLIPLLEDAIAAIGDTHPHLRVRLLGRLSGAVRDEPSLQRRRALSAEAVALARTLGDPAALAYALVARFTATWGPDSVDEMASLAAEIEAIAGATGDPERELDAMWLRCVSSMTRAEDGATTERIMQRYQQIADMLRQPSQRWYAGVIRTSGLLLDGKLDEAEEAAAATLQLGGDVQHWDAIVSYRLAMFAIRREQGRLEEVEDDVRRSLGEYPGYRLFRCLLALVLAETGRADEARSAIEAILSEGERGLPRDNGWLCGMVTLADACASTGDRGMASRIYDLLVPFGDQVALAAGEVTFGAAARALGVLAGLLGRDDDAEAHFVEALAVHARTGAIVWLARTQAEYARMLLQRDARGDRDQAAVLRGDALRVADRCGLRAVAALVRSMAPPTPRVAAPSEPCAMVREGEYWLIRFASERARVRDSKGMRYIAALLAAPGREIASVDLAAERGDTRAAEPDAHLVAVGDTGEVLDRRARDAYRRRIADLEEEREEARRFGDAERASKAALERDLLLEQLAAAVGFGGRPRRAGSHAERARLNVTRAIRAALERIDAAAPLLGRHLGATIRTGTMCSYAPDPRAPVKWQL